MFSVQVSDVFDYFILFIVIVLFFDAITFLSDAS